MMQQQPAQGHEGENLPIDTNSLKVFPAPGSHLSRRHLVYRGPSFSHWTPRRIPSYSATLLLTTLAVTSGLPYPRRGGAALLQTTARYSLPETAVPAPGCPRRHPAPLTASRGLALHSLSLQKNAGRQTFKEISVSTTTAAAAAAGRPGRSRPAARLPARWGAVGVVGAPPPRSAAGPRPLSPAARGGGSAGWGAGRAKKKK